MEINKELLKGHIDLLILSLLNIKDMYGYEIAKEIRLISKQRFELKEGTLYLSLKRLENIQLVTSYWSNESGAGARRKYYKMVELGKRNFEIKVGEWLFMKEIIDGCLDKSFMKEEGENVLGK